MHTCIILIKSLSIPSFSSEVIIAFAGSLLIALFSIPLVVRVTSMRNLTDRPGKRKIHKKAIPTLGGVGIYAGFAFGFLMTINGYMTGVTYFILATLMLFFAGMKDDLISLDPIKKLIAEILAALLLIYFTDIKITNFHGFMGIGEIPTLLTYITTIFIMVVIINSMNLIDGIDGLAATIGIVASTTFGIWFFLSGNIGYTLIAVSLAGTLIGFLRFNLSEGKNKIFMGDTGSLLVGFILSVMVILFNEVNTGTNTYLNLHSAPAISIAVLIIPLYDTLRVFTLRLYHNQHPFTADNRHIHHLMLQAGFDHKKTDMIFGTINIMMIVIAYFLDYVGIIWLSLILLSFCIFLTGIAYVLIYKQCVYHSKPVRNEDRTIILLILSIHRKLLKEKARTPVIIPVADKSKSNISFRDQSRLNRFTLITPVLKFVRKTKSNVTRN